MKNHAIWFILWLTVVLAGCGTDAVVPTITLDPELSKGKALFSKHCAACHATEEAVTIIGPSLSGIAGRENPNIEGQNTRQYIENSIMYPDAYLAEGYENLMPSTFGKTLTREEVNLLVEYLLTLE